MRKSAQSFHVVGTTSLVGLGLFVAACSNNNDSENPLITVNPPLQIPDSAAIPVPGSITEASVRTDPRYVVSNAFFGEQAADVEAQRLLQSQSKQSLSPLERQLVNQVAGPLGQRPVQSQQQTQRRWWQPNLQNLPNIFRPDN